MTNNDRQKEEKPCTTCQYCKVLGIRGKTLYTCNLCGMFVPESLLPKGCEKWRAIAHK